jgi:hypothetical protein
MNWFMKPFGCSVTRQVVNFWNARLSPAELELVKSLLSEKGNKVVYRLQG